MAPTEDTIVARATALGAAGVAIVRLSGSEAVSIADRSVRIAGYSSLNDVPPRYMATAVVVDGERVIDRCLIVKFAAPRSFTGEDVVEFHLHGNLIITQQVIALTTAAGARPASPGEFTRRGFLNGKLDLTQVEALADLLSVESERALLVSQRQFGGELMRKLQGFRKELLNLLALLELELDFVEEGYSFTSSEKLDGILDELLVFVRDLLATYQMGNRLRRGPRVLLLGRPNAGKSSLFNALIGYSRALVSSQAGTTRDYIEEVVTHGGIAFHVVDTAGLRETGDSIEAEGVAMASNLIPLADHLLYLIDPSEEGHIREELEAMEVLAGRYPDTDVIPVFTKRDQVIAYPSGYLAVSIYDRSSLTALLDHLAAVYATALADSIVLVSERQLQLLRAIEQGIAQAKRASSLGTEFLSADLRLLLEPLSELSGSTTNEDVLNQLFGAFCIGK